eukprot:GHVQ01004190.1.p1 GENE.GHVQ01004190.1~~GHVQ01004190.1.p1  ORF type:complete len:650 (+),score=88.40 GHVQ01004190.1:178-2127(+)
MDAEEVLVAYALPADRPLSNTLLASHCRESGPASALLSHGDSSRSSFPKLAEGVAGPQRLYGLCCNDGSCLDRRAFPSKVGGQPAWLDPIHLPEDISCDRCGTPMTFLMQLYAPQDAEHVLVGEDTRPVADREELTRTEVKGVDEMERGVGCRQLKAKFECWCKEQVRGTQCTTKNACTVTHASNNTSRDVHNNSGQQARKPSVDDTEVYAALLDDSDSVSFHRTLLVFVCQSCGGTEMSVYRCQLPRKNPFYSFHPWKPREGTGEASHAAAVMGRDSDGCIEGGDRVGMCWSFQNAVMERKCCMLCGVPSSEVTKHNSKRCHLRCRRAAEDDGLLCSTFKEFDLEIEPECTEEDYLGEQDFTKEENLQRGYEKRSQENPDSVLDASEEEAFESVSRERGAAWGTVQISSDEEEEGSDGGKRLPTRQNGNQMVDGCGLVEEDSIVFETFVQRCKRSPGHVVRYAYKGRPLWFAASGRLCERSTTMSVVNGKDQLDKSTLPYEAASDIPPLRERCRNSAMVNQNDRKLPSLLPLPNSRSAQHGQASTASAVTNCENCGSERVFEFQVQPAILHKAAPHLDFGVAVVYTCAKSCMPGYTASYVGSRDGRSEGGAVKQCRGFGYIKEFIYVQPEVFAEGAMNNNDMIGTMTG